MQQIQHEWGVAEVCLMLVTSWQHTRCRVLRLQKQPQSATKAMCASSVTQKGWQYMLAASAWPPHADTNVPPISLCAHPPVRSEAAVLLDLV